LNNQGSNEEDNTLFDEEMAISSNINNAGNTKEKGVES
jgi:hypothetical protein